MKPVSFDYMRASDVAAAISALAQAKGAGKLIAGGQSLGPMLNLRLARPGLLIDVSRIGELQSVEDRGLSWRIGAGVTHARIEDGETALGASSYLADVARQIAYRAVRNRGTVGGSLAHGDPAADWPLAFAVLEAEIEVYGPSTSRRIKAKELMVSAFTTLLSEDEIIVAVDVPKPSVSARWGYFKLCRKFGEFPIASAAVLIDPDRDVGRVFLGALPDRPRPLVSLGTQLLRGGISSVSKAVLARAVADTAPEIDTIDRGIYTACLARAVEQAFQV